MFRTTFIVILIFLLLSCSSVSKENQTLLMGTWVSDSVVTLREAEKEGEELPDWIREKLGNRSVIINKRKMSTSEVSTPHNERTWVKWSVSSETEEFIYIGGTTQRYNKNIGCLEQRWNIGVTDKPDHPDNVRYSHFYCKQSK